MPRTDFEVSHDGRRTWHYVGRGGLDPQIAFSRLVLRCSLSSQCRTVMLSPLCWSSKGLEGSFVLFRYGFRVVSAFVHRRSPRCLSHHFGETVTNPVMTSL